MSVYNKPDFKSKIGSTPSFIHKKNNSQNFTSNAGRFIRDNSIKLWKNKLEINNTQTNNTENNIVNNMNSNSNINKLLTTTNKNNRKIEINLNKNYSPTSRLIKTSGENIILLNNKQCTSQTNINHSHKISNKNNDNKECNIIINNNINNEKNDVKNKNLSNINININISKKIISTYYNKSKDKNNLIMKKKSINSVNNSDAKEYDKKNYYKLDKREDIKQPKNENKEKIQSSNILKKFSNKNTSLNNINGKENKSSVNLTSLAHFSTNSNISTNTNKNNYIKTNVNNSKNKILTNSHINYTSNDIYNINVKENNKKIQGNAANKITKEYKSMYLSQIQIPINSSSPRNINSIQNYLKYLHIGQKNSPQNRSKNQKLSANNINFTHNNTENNAYENTYNNTYIYEYNNVITQKNYKYNRKNLKNIPKGESKNKNNNIKENNSGLLTKRSKKNSHNINEFSNISQNKDIYEITFENPEELHYFFVKIFQKGKTINFDKSN